MGKFNETEAVFESSMLVTLVIIKLSSAINSGKNVNGESSSEKFTLSKNLLCLKEALMVWLVVGLTRGLPAKTVLYPQKKKVGAKLLKAGLLILSE